MTMGTGTGWRAGDRGSLRRLALARARCARAALATLATLVTLITLATLVGPARAQAEPPLAKVSVGIAATSADIGFFIAEKKGYFRDEGLQIETTRFASAAQMIAPLGSGQLDVGGGTAAAGLYNAVARRISLRIVADKGSIRDGYEYSTLLVRKDLADSGRYRTLADLKGLTVAVAAQGAGSESALNEALKKGGLAFSDVTTVYLGFPEHLMALSNRRIDASITTEPTVSMALHRGVAVRGAATPIYPGQQTAVVLYSESFIQHRALAEKFMRAYVRALRFYNDALAGGRLAGPNADAVIAILTEYTAIKDPAVYREMSPNAVDPDGRVNEAGLRNDLAFFRQRGLVKDTRIRVEDVVDGSFVEAAVRALGPYQPQAAR
jgi:NitT/TauT family transport system substrate-binding protein